MAKYKWWELAAVMAVVAVGAGAYIIVKATSRRRPANVPNAPVPGGEPAAGRATNARPASAAASPSRPRMTCAALNVVLRRDATTGKLTVMAESLAHVLSMSSHFTIVLIQQCASDADEDSARQALEEAGAFQNGLLRNNLLFCDTPEGLMHMARHLEPALHVDTDAEVVKTLAPHVQNVVLVAEARPSNALPPTVFVVRNVREVHV
ncbi:hypothetical protein CAOG_02734 [Capsaspora owczarzaki ATCC 30864]|uniref:Peroxisome assembly protein 22 n=1 Tax=Capsaspora owczarzaki (strain ATCC 30864) TaxID=595528 RepID=A0A0D2WLV3_CAPO3|nr:hypothetical protein CAOG_02734 [Capsaspora owczarzaki ATCC 30864]KJE91620.1 hypothetical protein CAOG_002734 [Capsaspora owczarzaki ATCC 30864]|eukprot:XP_004349484.1 hypothetical protein CAOG_02734 [Capsaspora owczarzaki ATCC 30864]